MGQREVDMHAHMKYTYTLTVSHTSKTLTYMQQVQQTWSLHTQENISS